MAKKSTRLSKTPRKPGRPPTGHTPPRSIRVPDEEWQRWSETALDQSTPLTLTAWLRQVANEAAAKHEQSKQRAKRRK